VKLRLTAPERVTDREIANVVERSYIARKILAEDAKIL
jgi:hypothetical protein